MEDEDERPSNKSFMDNINKEFILAITAIAIASGGTYYNQNQLQQIEEKIKQNEETLIMTVKNVDQMSIRTPESEKIEELRKSISMNSRDISEIKNVLKSLSKHMLELKNSIEGLENNASQWLGYHPEPKSSFSQQTQYTDRADLEPEEKKPPENNIQSIMDML